MMTLSGAVNIRGRHANLPKSKRYIHNALAFSGTRLPVCRDTPLVDIAVQSRRAVNKATTQASIDRSLAVMKEMHRSGRSMHVCEPFEMSYATTNWSGAWMNIDFSPASKHKTCGTDSSTTGNSPNGTIANGKPDSNNGSVVCEPTLVFGQALARDMSIFRYNSQIMSKTKEGYWVDFASSVKNMRLIDQLLKQNPSLEGF
ncbi:Alpha-1,2-mannosidase family protein [Fusarium austroafricanum]|uniref:Alpha-1,2-mannosidase family protein n=1 Tax=Fusarium austroafricanum TaxID=2364996 RepID=A0A8H4KVU3_9HYPO|nr:Alpha-1,2-mannosidase family protein [Fusarium austroafricanum]